MNHLKNVADKIKKNEYVRNQFDTNTNVLIDEIEIYLHQNGAPPHYVLSIWQWLENKISRKMDRAKRTISLLYSIK